MCRSLAACCDHGRLGQHDPGSLLAVAGSREGLGSLILQLRFWFFFVVPLFRFALFIYFFFIFVCIRMCSVSHTCLWVPWRPEEAVRSLGAEVKSGYEPPDVGVGT